MDNRAKIIIGAENQAGAGINHAKKDLRELGTAADRSGRQTKDSFRQATISSNSFSGSISKLYVSMASLAALVGAGAIARGFLETAASMERTRLMLEGLTGSTKEAQASMDWLLKFATTAPYQLSTLSDTFVKLRIAGIDPTAGSMQALVDAVAAFGGSNEQLQRASVAIMQMAGKGVISMEELRQQLGEAVPDAIHVMAHEMGMTVRDLTDMVSKGNLDALTGLTALFEGWAKKHKGAAETFAGSMSGLWNQLKLQYELFKNDMMSSGDSFITLKAGLKTVLDLVKRWREDGSIVEWSEHAVKAMWVVVEGIHYIGKAFLGWKIIWEGLKAAWDTTVAGIYASMAWLADKMGILLEKLADVQEFLNFDATADRTRIAAAGMREWADETSNVADVLIDDIATEGVKGIEDAVAAIINLDQKTAQLKASFYENVEALKAQAKAGKDAGSAMAEGTDETAKAIEKLDPKLEAAHQKLHDFLAIHSQADDAARSIAKLNIEYDRMAELLTDMQLAGYDVVEMSEQLERWYANSMDEITNKTEATTDKVYDAWSHMYERLQDVTADWIYDMKVDFDSIVDLFKRSVAEMISAWIWGQQNMQFATSGQGGFSLGGMFGGMFGGGGAGGGGQTAAQAAMAAGYGPVAEEWALANGFTNTLQGAQSAYSLYGAYGAYQGAGGGWAGAKAGAGSFFGGGSASSLTYASWIAAAVIVAAQVLGKYNAEHGYGRIEGTPQGYNVSQTMHPFAGGDWASSSWLTDPAANWLRGISGDKSPSGSDWFAYHLKEGNWEDAFFASFESALEWSNIGLAQTQRKLMEILGIPGPGEILGYSNKKRSYLTRDYDYTYDLAEGWSDPSMTHIRSKRGGEDAFGEAADWMSEGVSSILNSIEELTTGFLGAVDEKWVNQFKTSMMSLGELGFKFNISAEDEDEFADDMEKSFSAALDGVINPVMSIAADFMRQATEEAFTSPEIEKVFGILSDDIAEFLRDDMAKVLSIFDAPLPTTADEFEAYISSLSVGMDEIVALLSYFQAITDITDEISAAFARTSLTQSLIDINTRFIELGQLLESLGIDLTKYTDFTKAWGIALAEATYGFSADGMVAELKKIMDAPNAMAAAEQFTLDFIQQVRDGMVNSITSAFTEMMYAQMLAPLAETFLEGAETPEELMAGIHNYISAVRDIMQDPAMITGLQSIGAAMWEINQMIPSAEQLATYEDLGAVAGDLIVDGAAQAADLFGTSVRSAAQTIDSGGMSAGYHLISGGQTAASYIANAARALASIGTTAVPMAAGAIVTRPTYSLIGEAGYDEVVLPLDNRHKLVAKMEKGSQQKTTITIPLTVMTEDGRILKREIIKETFAEMKERSGRREIIIHAAGVA